MKTIYTLLLAFGLCLTSHAQSNNILTLAEKQLTLTSDEYNTLIDRFDGATPALIFSYDYFYVVYDSTLLAIEKIVLEDKYVIGEFDTDEINLDFNLIKTLKLNWKSGNSFNLHPKFLNKLKNIEYVYVVCDSDIDKNSVNMLLNNVLAELNQGVQVIYNVAHGG